MGSELREKEAERRAAGSHALGTLQARLQRISGDGLEKIGAAEANKIMLDLLQHPTRHCPRPPRIEANAEWGRQARQAWERFCEEIEAPEWKRSQASSASGYPPFALAWRLRELDRAGADMPKAFGRCCFRKDYDAARELLKMPAVAANPNPSSSSGAPLLFRVAYQGPNDLLDLLLKAIGSDVSKWGSAGDKGMFPEEWAQRAQAKGRMGALLKVRLGADPETALGGGWEKKSPEEIRAILEAKAIDSAAEPAGKRKPGRRM